jgi:exosortase
MPPVSLAAGLLTAILFGLLFAKSARSLGDAWWNDPNSGHGLLLFPLSLWLAYRAGVHPHARPAAFSGLFLIFSAVLFRYAADLAAELFVLRGSMLLAGAGLVIWQFGWRQAFHWWLPFTLLALSVPIPDVVLNSVALPLQFTASQIGAGLLEWREIPVRLSGNVILIPGHQLFVAEACSGLRSLTALISLGVLLSAMFLSSWWLRMLLVALTVPVAIIINGVRVFATGFLVRYVSPEMGEGFMHTSEGMVMFGGAFLVTGALTWMLGWAEKRLQLGATVDLAAA